jgi:hypothetical protein
MPWLVTIQTWHGLTWVPTIQNNFNCYKAKSIDLYKPFECVTCIEGKVHIVGRHHGKPGQTLSDQSVSLHSDARGPIVQHHLTVSPHTHSYIDDRSRSPLPNQPSEIQSPRKKNLKQIRFKHNRRRIQARNHTRRIIISMKRRTKKQRQLTTFFVIV